MKELIPIERIESKVFLIRGQKVMLDFDLADLYEVETKQLKRQVRRNITRFPNDFMFQLTKSEYDILRCQIGTLKHGQHTKYLPYVFTEQGVAMLSTVLNSEKAIQVNITIMRAFVKLNRILTSHVEVSRKLKELEQKTLKNEKDLQGVFAAIRRLIIQEGKPVRKIGFVREREG